MQYIIHSLTVFLFIFFTGLFTITCHAQESSLTPSHQELKSQYEWIDEYTQGLALARKGNEFCVINKLGEKQFDFPYQEKELKFRKGWAKVKYKGCYGLIDTLGNSYNSIQYEKINYLSNGIAKAQILGKNGIVDIRNEEFYETEFIIWAAIPNRKLIVEKDEKTGVINWKNEVIIPFVYDRLIYGDDSNLIYSKNKRYGTLSMIGEEKIPGIYQTLTLVAEDLFLVRINDRWGVVNSKNEELIPPTFEKISVIGNCFLVQKENKYGLLDFTGIKFIPVTNDKFRNLGKGIVSFSQGEEQIFFDCKAVKETSNPNYSEGSRMIEMESSVRGKTIIQNKETYKIKHDRWGLYVVEKNGLKGLMNSKEKLLIPTEYNLVVISELGVKVQKNKLFGLYDFEGKELLPIEYRRIQIEESGIICRGQNIGHSISEGLFLPNLGFVLESDYCSLEELSYGKFIASKDCKNYGVLDLETSKETEYQYHKVRQDKNGATFLENGSYGFMNLKGEIVIPSKYDQLKYSYGNYIIAKSDSIGLIDPYGKLLISFNYKNLNFSIHSRAYIAVNANNKSGLLTSNGKILIPFEYDQLSEITYSENILAKKQGLWGVVDKKENIILPFIFDEMSDDLGISIFVKKKKWALFSRAYKQLSDFQFDDMAYFDQQNVLVEINSKYGLIDRKGNEVLPIVFESISNKYESGNIGSIVNKLKFEDYIFIVDTKMRCIHDCPDEEILKKIGLIKR